MAQTRPAYATSCAPEFFREPGELAMLMNCHFVFPYGGSRGPLSAKPEAVVSRLPTQAARSATSSTRGAVLFWRANGRDGVDQPPAGQ